MRKIVIFGNSGSGKSTLARQQADSLSCAHLDLDTIAWEDGHDTPTRKPLSKSGEQIALFLANKQQWVIEGCYSDLLELVLQHATEIIFLNPGNDTCIANCRSRPWEPHKYDSLEAQNENLPMLLSWVAQYDSRQDEFSLHAHRMLYDAYEGYKREYTSNARDT